MDTISKVSKFLNDAQELASQIERAAADDLVDLRIAYGAVWRLEAMANRLAYDTAGLSRRDWGSLAALERTCNQLGARLPCEIRRLT